MCYEFGRNFIIPFSFRFIDSTEVLIGNGDKYLNANLNSAEKFSSTICKW